MSKVNHDLVKRLLRAGTEICEQCNGTGTQYYPPHYIDGDLYYDGERLRCNDCKGKGRVKRERVPSWYTIC